MRVLITGNLGYVGPALARHLRLTHPDWILDGLDSGFFAECLPDPTLEALFDRQHFADMRDIGPHQFDGIDAVVLLAAISNDPMGARFAAVTDAINHRAVARIADMAAQAGVRALVFASSCSVYGAASDRARREDDMLDPRSEYAHSKIAAEAALRAHASTAMHVTCLRFATACGWAPRLRLDLVLNDLVAHAVLAGEINVLSDGTPWRPLIDVADMARAIDWAIGRDGAPFCLYNTGSDDWNWQIRTLAEAVAAAVPGALVRINADAPSDPRSYRVDFSRFATLAPHHQPRMTLSGSIQRLRQGIIEAGLTADDLRAPSTVRLKKLDQLIAAGRLAPDLRWRAP